MWWLARREYLERLRSRAFLVATVLGPLVMAALILGPALLATRPTGKPLRVAVLDGGSGLRDALATSLTTKKVAGLPRFEPRALPPAAGTDALEAARQAVLRGDLDGFVYLPPDCLERSVAEYHGRYVSNAVDLGMVDAAVEEAFLQRRLSGHGLGPEQVRGLTRKPDLKTVRLTARGGGEDGKAGVVLAVVLMMMLYTAVAMWGAAIMNGVIEEKSNRVVEVLVSSVPSTALFTAKLLGVGAVGLTQFAVWVLSLGIIGTYATTSVPLLSDASVPLLAGAAGFFVLGYFLYGALYAALGAAVNTPQEAQALAFPVMSPLVAAVAFFPAVMGRPDGPLAVALTLVPFFAPLLMFLRVALLPPPAWQVALSVALTVAAIAGVTWAAARIYRVGILMYGKRPTLPEMLKWVGRD
jgi:ABC-2 type transport system permease protein